MRDGVDAEAMQQVGQGGVVEHPPGGRGEHEPLSVEELRRAVEHLERPGRERHPVLAARLHALGRNRPHRPVPVDLLPPGVAHLARARGGEHWNSNASMLPRQAPEPFTRASAAPTSA